MSAYELLNQIGLIEDAITCLFSAGRQTQAIKLAEDYLEQSLDTISKSGEANKSISQANILCLIGDMKRDESWYEKAWQVSG